MVVNGVLGFDVIREPGSGALVPSVPNGTITLERLTKENVKEMDSPTRVIEATGIRVLYRRGLSSNSRLINGDPILMTLFQATPMVSRSMS